MTVLVPPIIRIKKNDTHRLIPFKYSADGKSVLADIANNDEHFYDITDLDNATNDRLLAENDFHEGISAKELVYTGKYYKIVNAAFTHPAPQGNRFSSPVRNAWYAGFTLKASQREIIFHKTVEYEEINFYDDEPVTYDDYMADFNAEFHDIRDTKDFANCLNPNSYVASQNFADILLESGANGVIYPSVRHRSGTCLVCFRPNLIQNVRKHARYKFKWSGSLSPSVEIEKIY